MNVADLIAPARLFGRLLLHELDADTLALLRQPDVAAALETLDVRAPHDAQLDALGAEFFALVLQPRAAPPLVQSLWQEARYEGDAALAVRRVASAAGLQLAAGARAAPPDHLGCLLDLWAELHDERPQLAAQLARDHLAWVARSSAPTAPAERFYGQVLRASAALAATIVSSAAAALRDGERAERGSGGD